MTWKQLTERDCREWKLSAIDPHNRDTWRSSVRSAMHAASQLHGRGLTVVDCSCTLYLHVNQNWLIKIRRKHCSRIQTLRFIWCGAISRVKKDAHNDVKHWTLDKVIHVVCGGWHENDGKVHSIKNFDLQLFNHGCGWWGSYTLL